MLTPYKLRTVSELCKTAGVSGFKTNHSLRVTTAIRLFQNGLDEQLIIERTGHCSLDWVRGYKRTSQEQQELVSAALNNPTKIPKVGNNDLPVIDLTKREPLSLLSVNEEPKESPKGSISSSKPQSLSLTGCSGITINFH